MNGHQNGAFSCLIGALNRPRKVNGYGADYAHQTAATPDEDEHIAVLHLTLHPLMHHPAQRTDTLAHICPAGTQIVAHRVVKAEHGSRGFCPTNHAAIPLCRCQSGHAGH